MAKLSVAHELAVWRVWRGMFVEVLDSKTTHRSHLPEVSGKAKRSHGCFGSVSKDQRGNSGLSGHFRWILGGLKGSQGRFRVSLRISGGLQQVSVEFQGKSGGSRQVQEVSVAFKGFLEVSREYKD